MKPTSSHITYVYLVLNFLSTLAASFIWGINTLFLLNAGLTNMQTFGTIAYFMAGQVLFEVPTGMVADSLGRRTSYLLGTLTLSFSTLLYIVAWQTHAAYWVWAVSSVLLGLGFTFFSGATEAWLVDALTFTGHKGSLDAVFAKGQIVGGIAMLVGSVSGGLVAQATNLGIPYIVRALVLAITFIVAFIYMKDLGFTPTRSKRLVNDVRNLFGASFKHGLGNPPVRWVMLASPFTMGVGFYVFYALQPYLLSLYGDVHAYWIAGLTAAIVAGAQIAGGIAVPHVKKFFHRRTSLMLSGTFMGVILLLAIGLLPHFWVVLLLVVIWALLSAAITPVRQAYLNELIPTAQRATVLSFDSLVGSVGGIVVQPALGRVVDLWNYQTSFVGGAAFQAMALPFLLLAKTKRSSADTL